MSYSLLFICRSGLGAQLDKSNSISALQTRRTCITAVETQVSLTTSTFALRHLTVPAELVLRCRRPYFAEMATVRRPHCVLIRTPSDSFCFVHVHSARRCSALKAIRTRLKRCHCDATAMLRLYCERLGVQNFQV